MHAQEVDQDYKHIEAAMIWRQKQREDHPLSMILANIMERAMEKENQHRLMEFVGRVGSAKFDSMLLDSGAQISVLSEAAARALRLNVTEGPAITVQGFNGAQHECRHAVRDISIQIGEYSGQHSFIVAPLPRFDVILGMDFLSQFSEFSFKPENMLVKLTQKNGIVAHLHPKNAPASEFLSLSSTSVCNNCGANARTGCYS